MVSAVDLRSALDNGDAPWLERLIAVDPELPRRRFTWGVRCGIGPCQPLGYLAQARFNGFVNHDKSGELTHLLLTAGALVDGEPGDGETPLITAASYREPRVAAALIGAGADLEATGYAVKGGTALAHAIEFGAPEIVSMLIAAGARVRTLADAAGAGAIQGMLESVTGEQERAQALRAAALCERLPVIDQLLDTGIDVNRLIEEGTALHWAAWEAKLASVRHLIARGADFRLADPQHQGTPLGWAKHRVAECPHAHPGGHGEVIRLLEGLERQP